MDNAADSQVDWLFSPKKDDPAYPNVPPPDSEIYKSHRNRGVAIIFNHKEFSISNCPTRYGTDKDRDDLKEILTHLKFDVMVHNDLNYDEVLEVLRIVSKMDHTSSDCLVIIVMSHGLEGELYAKDRPYPTRKLWTNFSGLHCPSLAGKPKMFFIQACRGSKSDPGVTVAYDETDSTPKEKFYSIPVMADFLIMYSTVDGYYSWRDPENGSYFIQALVRQLKLNHGKKDLVSILTCVNREVAVGFTSVEPYNPQFNGKKEMCSIVSMLTRDFFLN